MVMYEHTRHEYYLSIIGSSNRQKINLQNQDFGSMNLTFHCDSNTMGQVHYLIADRTNKYVLNV